MDRSEHRVANDSPPLQCFFGAVLPRAGLSIGQTEQLPRAPHFGGPTHLLIFSCLIVRENFGKFRLKLRPADVMMTFFCSSLVSAPDPAIS